MISYPSGEVTPNQFRRLIQGDEPLITYVSYDGSATFHLMGPLAPVIGVQEGVSITRESIKGLIAPWQTLDQAGANQDGVTFNDSVAMPAEIDMVVEAHGLTTYGTRRVIRDWISSWDSKLQGTLYVFTRENGMWFAPVRWLKAPTDVLMRSKSLRQRFVWTCRIDDAFWRYADDSVSSTKGDYNSFSETFNYTTAPLPATATGTAQVYVSSLGANWPIRYTGAGGGLVVAKDGSAVWIDDPNDWLFTRAREAVCGPYKDAVTATDNQVVYIVLGTMPEMAFPTGAYNDVWGRMGRSGDGKWNGYGIRLRIGVQNIELSSFSNFTKTVMASRPLIIRPTWGDKWTLVCGFEGDTRLFKVLRNDVEILAHKEGSDTSALGPSYRGFGFGMYASNALITQATPGRVRKVAAGVNSAVSQASYLTLTNIGDVPAWPRYLLYGPGNFRIGNGPGSTDMVEFGPLLDGQVVLIETEPRRRAVVDLSPSAPAEQDLTRFQELIKSLVSFASNGNVPPLLQEFESLFGILPPQGNLYSYLNGRFTQPIPAKSPGEAASTSFINVSIDNGNANSKIVGALSPRRRWPL